MYSFRFSAPRYGAVLFLMVAMWVGFAVFGDGDWQIWPLIIGFIVYGIGMFVQSFRAVEMAVEQSLADFR
ncbi:hypothetical protein [Sphingobium sp. SCG-1]|uniref:hypothetical protein n=1 Tax=Sphingobium sp. SCG-1 TaxID=2072936 RepID=UPI0011AB44CC|nr:hypothetical protein [Sphingobium sp. SCG-1]